MSKHKLMDTVDPVIFCESLVRGTAIPVYFGKHEKSLVGGMGEVAKHIPIFISRRACGSKHVEACVVRLIQVCGYKSVQVMPDLVKRGSGSYGSNGDYRICGEPCQHIGG